MRIKNWDTFTFLAVYHVLVVALAPFAIAEFSWAALAVFLTTYIVGGLSITVGYHRLFSHQSYKAHPVFESIILLTSTLAFQWSAYAWSHDHRKHHSHVDTDEDPYSIKKGFWYAHVLWLFDYDNTIDPKIVRDLGKNPRVMFQHRHFLALTWTINLAVVGIACLFMSPLAALFWAFALRVFCIHHSTWFINSLAHTWGSKTYARELSAVDNAILALLTFGEGYHNYHHAFAHDYRNGIRWWHFDPTKWIVWTASKLGLAKNLKTVDRVMLQKKLVSKDRHILIERLSEETEHAALELRNRLESLAHSFEDKTSELSRKYSEFRNSSKTERQAIQHEIKLLRREVSSLWKNWVATTRRVVTRYHLEHSH